VPLAESLPVRGPQPRILIVRVSALGDIVFATSLLEGLRARFPAAYIAWLAQDGFAPILEGDARLDEVIRVPGSVYGAFWRWPRLRRELGARHFDWVIDGQGLLKTRLLARLVPGAVRIGFESKEPGRSWMDHVFPKGGDLRDISSEYRYLAEQITGQPSGAPRLLPTGAVRARVADAMRARGLAPGFVALCPFTTRPQKHWFEDRWPPLAALLAAPGGPPCVLFGGPGDRDAAQRIFAGLPQGSVNLVGETKLSDLPAWLEQAGLVIGVDTGLTHIGIAMRRPVVALFGSTCPYTQGAQSPLRVAYEPLPCSPCRRDPTCGGTWTCMRLLTPERVAATARGLLEAA